MDALSSLRSNKARPGRIAIIVSILSVYNCRISEVLCAVWPDYYSGKYLILRGKKNSRDIVVRDQQIIESIGLLYHIHPRLIFYPINYQSVYYFLKSNYSHLFNNEFDKKNKKVTHYFRYANSQPLQKRKDATLVLNHKSKSSARFYNNNLEDN